MMDRETLQAVRDKMSAVAGQPQPWLKLTCWLDAEINTLASPRVETEMPHVCLCDPLCQPASPEPAQDGAR